MRYERSSTQMPCRQAWQRPAEAGQWGAAWCRVPLADSEVAPQPVTPRLPPIRTAPVPIGGTLFGVVAAECHDGVQGSDGVEPEKPRRATRGRTRVGKGSTQSGQLALLSNA